MNKIEYILLGGVVISVIGYGCWLALQLEPYWH
jgi:hypothetical protein